jgi:hypothetical protein
MIEDNKFSKSVIRLEEHLELKEPRVNWSQATKTVLDQYDGALDAVQKEAIQNAYDAKVVNSANWKIEIRYLPDEQKLEIEDFGTTGIMQWEYYKNLWFSEKAFEKGKGGSRGQGKFVLVALGEYVITETISNGKYRIVFTNRNAAYNDSEEKLSQYIKRKLNHQGTLITVYNIRAEFQKEFADHKKMIRYIQQTWWRLIENKAKIIYRVGKREYQIPKLKRPSFTIHKKFDDIPVKYATKDDDGNVIQKVGKITDIDFYYNKGSDLEEFRGKIAITVNGQTIEWWEPSISPPYNNRFFGTLEAEYLRDAEQPNHSKFKRDHDAWKVTRITLDELVQKFLRPIYEKDTSVDKKSLHEALLAEELLNRAFLEGFHDIDPLGEVPKQTRKRQKYTDVYIRYLLLDHKEYQQGDTVFAKSLVANPQDEEKDNYGVRFSVIDPKGSKIMDTKHTGLVFKNKDEKEFEFKLQLPENAIKGSYLAILSVVNSSDIEVYESSKGFEVAPELSNEEKKPKDDYEVKTKNTKKVPIRVKLKLGVFDDGRLVRFIPSPTNAIYVNYKHGSIDYIRRNAPKALVYHLVVAGGEELIRLKYKSLIDDAEEKGEELSSENMKRMMDDIIFRNQELEQWTGSNLTGMAK